MKKTYALVIVLVVLLLLAPCATAAPESKPEVDVLSGLEALAISYTDQRTVYIGVFEVSGNTYLLYLLGFADENGDYHVYAPVDADLYLGGMFPVVEIDKDSANIDPKFLSASVSSVPVTIADMYGTSSETKDITINAYWTSTSDITRNLPYHYIDTDGDVSISTSASRTATITGSISGSGDENIDMDLGTADFMAGIGRGLTVRVTKDPS